MNQDFLVKYVSYWIPGYAVGSRCWCRNRFFFSLWRLIVITSSYQNYFYQKTRCF